MSNAIMKMAWKAALPATRKVVLVALADAANDRGECFPSVQTLASMCSLSDRAVQKAVSELEKGGYLVRDQRKGRSTIYQLTVENWPDDSEATPERGSPHPRTTFTPEQDSPPNDVHPTPERGSPPPPNVVHPTPEPRSPITPREPPIEPLGNQNQGEHDEYPEGLNVEAWEEFLAYRKEAKLRALKPMSRRKKIAWLVKQGDEAVQREIVDQSIANGWQGLFELKGGRHSLPAAHGGFEKLDYSSGIGPNGEIL